MPITGQVLCAKSIVQSPGPHWGHASQSTELQEDATIIPRKYGAHGQVTNERLCGIQPARKIVSAIAHELFGHGYETTANRLGHHVGKSEFRNICTRYKRGFVTGG